jgi:two-component system sensor histidine kinase/response regulator
MTSHTSNPKILVIDDQPINVQLLKRKLEREGLDVIAAHNGREGLEAIAKAKPDLVLLDVMMPDMNGIEVCQQLQANEETRAIPVIFITARTTKESKLEGLGVGAVDYITKPIDLDETLARVQTQLRFVSINREMVDLQRRLEEARRSATIGAVTEGIAHNLNNLLGVAVGYLDLIKVTYDKPEKVQKNVERIDTALHRIIAIVRQLSSLEDKAHPPVSKASLSDIIHDGVARFQRDFRISTTVTIDNPLGDLPIETNLEAIEDVFSKVLINAWEAYDVPEGFPRPITIRTRLVDLGELGEFAEICVDDQGHGILPEVRDQMFEPFVSTKNTVGVGMGLTVARHALRNLGGEITVVDRAGGGASAILRHPLLKQAPLEDTQAEALARLESKAP